MRVEPLPISAAAFATRMDDLRFGFGKWDLHVGGKATVPASALVLSREEHHSIVRDAEALTGLAARARDRIKREPALAQGLGIPSALLAAGVAEADAQLATRLDFFRTRQGWQVSEFNDDCPGGYNEAIGLPALLGDALPPGTGLAGDLPDALVRLATAMHTDAGPLALLYATGYSEDLQVVEMLRRLLDGAGMPSVLASPSNLELQSGRLHVLGGAVGGLFRFFPADWLLGLPNWKSWGRLGASGIPVSNPLSAVLTQSKAIHGWLHANTGGHDRELVQRLLPPTRLLDDSTARDALAEPHRFVLKPTFGRMGEAVVLGRECPPATWRKRVTAATRAARTRPFVVQDRFDSVPVETQPGRTATACVGAYVVAGRFAGYYSRLAHGPLVAHDATNVLTVVEGL